MKTTIVIPSYDEAELLRVSLPAAAAQEDAEIVVVDASSADGSAALAREHGARVVSVPGASSYCEAIEAGIDAAGGDSVLLTNADCFLEPGFLAAARPRLAEPGVGAVAPKLIRTLGPGAGERLDAIDAASMTIDRRRKNTIAGHGRPSGAFDLPGECFGVDGAAALYRRETLEDCRIEGRVFDPDFERWASDVDLAWRARALGWRCVYEPGAVAYHVRCYSPSTRRQMSRESRQMQFRNRYLMMAKNDTLRDLLRDSPRILAWEAAALAYTLLREPHLLLAYRDAARRLPAALRKRRELAARRSPARVPFGLEPQP
ncbi:MAG: glycosyltransferase [Thermoleophilaceae bacterium]|nr:glycosyltransferase [Thermoleophilaceae bacterium]